VTADLANWTPRPWPERRVFEGAYVRLEPLDPGRHGDDLFEAGSGPQAERLFRYLGEGPFPDDAAFQGWLDRSAASEDPLFFAAIDKATGRAEGRLSLMRIDPSNGVIETGHLMFGPRLAQTRAGTEAIYLLAAYVFDELGYRRFEWKCNDRNEPSKRAALRFGFTFEGVFRQHMVIKGESRDTAWFSTLDGEWPAHRRAFQRWLDPANFDEAGRQRIGLSALNAKTIVEEAEAVVRLRRAARADAARLAAFQQAAYAPNRTILGVEPLPLTMVYGEVLDTYEAWLIEADEVLGALILDPQPDHLLIWSVASAPVVQRRGIGKRLLAAAEARARALGVSTLRLYTGEKLTGNVRWYHRHGYVIERVEERPDRRIVHMVKVLS
jgi:RimJ/RimL family protein N-acetyltransferase/ribosomal protein S18 acetylase RimI-like enzyme